MVLGGFDTAPKYSAPLVAFTIAEFDSCGAHCTNCAEANNADDAGVPFLETLQLSRFFAPREKDF